MNPDEVILCLPRPEFEALGIPAGFTRGRHPAWLPKAVRRRRGDVEGDDAQVQVCTYTLVRRGLDLFAYLRPERQGDPRLDGRLSIGVGGHLTERDGGGSNPGFVAAVRELHEELAMPAGGPIPRVSWMAAVRPLGAVYDPADALGREHLGLVYLAEWPGGQSEPACADGSVAPLGFRRPGDLAGMLELMESWSRLIVAEYFTDHGVAGDTSVWTADQQPQPTFPL